MRPDARPQSFAERRHFVVFLALVAFGIALMTVGVKSPERIDGVERAGLFVTGSVARAGEKLSSVAEGGWEGVAATWAAKRDLAVVQEQLRDARLALQDREELAGENERLRRLLVLRERLPLRTIAAAVIDRMASPDCILVIDRGTSDGVREDAPVVAPDGVVGKVLTATADTAKVQCVIDRDAGIAVRVGDRRAEAIVKDGSGGLCRLRYLGRLDEVAPGERVVTSGLDQVYPKGLLVGTVKEVRDEGGLERDVTVTPAVDFDRLDEVMVVLPEETSGEARPTKGRTRP